MSSGSLSTFVVASLAATTVLLAGCSFGGAACPDGADTPLHLGTLLPVTGSLAAFGGSMEKGAQLAVEQINAVGGVNGNNVRLFTGDSKTSPTEAPTAFLSLVNNDVIGVVGAASSGVTGSILDLAIDNEVFVISPASTSPALTLERDNEGWFARVPPSDALQGKVLAALVADDGHDTASILAVNNAYGTGLGQVFKQTFEAGGGNVLETVLYEETGTTFSSQVQLAGQGSPDAIVLIGYPLEGAPIMREAFEKGIMDSSTFYFSEGVKDEAGFVQVVGDDSNGDAILAGLKGTVPESSGDTAGFEAAYEARWGSSPNLFSAETYDGIMVLALTAAYAGEHCGEALRDNIREVYNGPGVKVSASNLQDAFDRAHNGDDIDYAGVSNDFDLDANGDPATGIYGHWIVNADGTISTTQSGIVA